MITTVFHILCYVRHKAHNYCMYIQRNEINIKKKLCRLFFLYYCNFARIQVVYKLIRYRMCSILNLSILVFISNRNSIETNMFDIRTVFRT